MSEKVYVGYYFNKERPLLQFKAQFSKGDLLDIFRDNNLGLTAYSFGGLIEKSPNCTQREGSFVIESSQRARDITEKLIPVLEQRGFELVYPLYFFKAGKK